MIQSRALYPTSKISSALAISKCGRERVRMREQWRERITQKHRGEHWKGHIFSKKAYLAISPCRAVGCTNNSPLSPGDTKSIKVNFQRQNGCSTKIMSDLWGFSFCWLLSRMCGMIQQTIAVRGYLLLSSLRSLWTYYHWQASTERWGTKTSVELISN